VRGVTLDASSFYNVYDHLRSVHPPGNEVRLEGPPPYIVVPFTLESQIDGTTYGFELAATWQAADWWRLSGTYGRLTMDLVAQPGSGDNDWQEGYSPRQQASVRSATDLPCSLQADVWVRYVGELERPPVKAYVTTDARLAWSPWPSVELSLVGQNLLQSAHAEFIAAEPEVTLHTTVRRGVYGAVTWRF